MMWAIFPVIAAVFYNFSSYIENELVDNSLPKKKAGAFAFLHIPGLILSLILLLAIFGRPVFMMEPANAIGLMVAGAVNVIGHIYYYRALQTGDNIDITIFSQTSPLITLGLGVLFLGETITTNQAIGFMLILLAVAVIIFASSKKRTPDFKTAGITLISTFFSVASDVIFVYFLPKTGVMDVVLFGQSFFFFQMGSLIFSALLFVILLSWREAAVKSFFRSKKAMRNSALAAVENICFYIGDMAYKFCLIIVPVVALLKVVGKGTSLFVSLFLTIILSKVFPRAIKAGKFSKDMAVRYLIAGVLVVVGILVMN
jgi:uncharacterized membrane protein